MNIAIVPPYNDFPVEKIKTKKTEENKNEKEKKDDKDKKEKEKEKKEEEDKDNNYVRMRLRSMPVRLHNPEKKTYKIKRAIIYKRQRKDSQ